MRSPPARTATRRRFLGRDLIALAAGAPVATYASLLETAPASAVVVDAADLAVTKTGPISAAAGDNVIYTITHHQPRA